MCTLCNAARPSRRYLRAARSFFILTFVLSHGGNRLNDSSGELIFTTRASSTKAFRKLSRFMDRPRAKSPTEDFDHLSSLAFYRHAEQRVSDTPPVNIVRSMNVCFCRSDTDRSDIISPVPRRHLTIQRNESQHWLGSPPLSPVSTASRAVSPLSTTFIDTQNPRGLRKHTQSFSLLLDHGKRQSSLVASISKPRERQVVDGSPARKWSRWMHKQGFKSFALPLVILMSALIRWCIGLGSYSGMCASFSLNAYLQPLSI